MSNEKLQPYETKMQKSLDALEREYTTIRAGRANPHILDKLKVDYYGTPTPLQQVGNVTVPEARVLMIQPWESKLIKDIEKAILASDIGITPTNDGKSIRLVFPELTEERRKELAKDVKKKGMQRRLQSAISVVTAMMLSRRATKPKRFLKMNMQNYRRSFRRSLTSMWLWLTRL